MKALLTIAALVAALALAACGEEEPVPVETATLDSSDDASDRAKPEEVPVPPGPPPQRLVEEELIEGTGTIAKAGDEVTVNYVGVDFETGEQFDASWDHGEPFTFELGAGMVIPGWEEGVAGMRVGGRRMLVVPPDLAYGETGAPPAIAPEATLVFVVDLLEVE